MQTIDGGYIIGGYSDSKISGDKTQDSKGMYDYWVVKLDNAGNIKWDKTIGGNAIDYLRAIQQTSDGGYILGGTSGSKISGDKTHNSIGANDYWIVKLDGSGEIQWDKTIGGNKEDELYSLQQTRDNGYVLGGYSLSGISGNKTQSKIGRGDYWIVKLSTTGKIQWDKTFGGKDADYLLSIQQTSDDGYILDGYSYSDSSATKSENSRGSSDFWVIKLDVKGQLQWDKTIGGNVTEYLTSVKELNKDKYIIAGESESDISGDKTKNSKGRTDYWIVYLDYNNTSKSIAASNKINSQSATTISKNFSAYPNPVKDILYVKSKTKTIFSLTDASGKTILTKTIVGNGEINVADLTPGVYYLKNNETGLSQKIVVVR